MIWKRLWRSVLPVAVLAVTSMTAAAATSDVEYAPPDTDLIIRINGEKLCKSKLFAPLRATRDFRRCENDMRNSLVKAGMTMDELLCTDIFIFADTRMKDLERLPFTLLARNRNGFAPKMLMFADNYYDDEANRDTLKKTAVGGREARLIDDGEDAFAVIALEDDLAAVLVNTAAVLPTRRPGSKLAAGLRSDALISIVFKNDRGLGRKFAEQLPQVAAPFLEEAVAAKADLVDTGDRIVLKAELTYATAERAQEAYGQFSGVIMMGVFALRKKNPEWVKILTRIRVTVNGRKVSISLKCGHADLNRALQRR